MAELTSGERRAVFIVRAREAVKAGLSQAQFLRQADMGGYSYRRVQMITDWHAVGETEKKKDLLKYVRKDYLPSVGVVADVPWNLSREYMYKVQVSSRARPGEAITERFVNIMHDRLLSPGEIEALAWQMIREQSPRQARRVEEVTAYAAIRRVEE